MESTDAEAVEKLGVMLFCLNKDHPNLKNVLLDVYSLLGQLNATMATCPSDDTMRSRDTHRKERLLRGLAELKTEITEMFERRSSEIEQRFAREKLSHHKLPKRSYQSNLTLTSTDPSNHRLKNTKTNHPGGEAGFSAKHLVSTSSLLMFQYFFLMTFNSHTTI